MKILAFAASNHSKSINRALVEFTATRFADQNPGTEIVTLDLNDYEMPIYSQDRENADGVHPLAQAFRDQISAVDGVIVAFCEHNGFVSAAWKNIFDWMSRIDQKVWCDKPMILLAASPGSRAGANVLASQEMLAPYFGCDLQGTYGVGKWGEAWDGTALTRAEDITAIDDLLSKLAGTLSK